MELTPAPVPGRLRGRLGTPVRMGAGLAMVGAAGYGFQALAGHTLPAADKAAALAVYVIINIIGPGVFTALEQETSRATSGALTVGRSIRPVAVKAALLGLVLLVVVLIALSVLLPVLVGPVLHRNWLLYGAIMLGAVSAAGGYLVRGILSGTRRYDGYAVTLAVEGLSRLLPCVFVAVASLAAAPAYSFIFAIGTGCAGLAGLPWALRPVQASSVSVPGEAPGQGRQMTYGLLALVGASLLTQLVANAAPVEVSGKLIGNPSLAASFTAAFGLVRLPLFLFAPVPSVLLPGLTEAAVRGRYDVVRTRLRLILLAVAAVGVPGAIATLLLGPWANRVLFGMEVGLPTVVFGVLGVSTVMLMIAQVLQPALIALGRHRMATLAWAAGCASLFALFFLPGDPISVAVVAQVSAGVLVVLVMGVALFAALRSNGRSTPAPEQVDH
ncbi:MAG: hypothetical protein JOZ47_07900 [Kutzneria sp.]|nr:hypothetical protein [Kutzneria sp.]